MIKTFKTSSLSTRYKNFAEKFPQEALSCSISSWVTCYFVWISPEVSMKILWRDLPDICRLTTCHLAELNWLCCITALTHGVLSHVGPTNMSTDIINPLYNGIKWRILYFRTLNWHQKRFYNCATDLVSTYVLTVKIPWFTFQFSMTTKLHTNMHVCMQQSLSPLKRVPHSSDVKYVTCSHLKLHTVTWPEFHD